MEASNPFDGDLTKDRENLAKILVTYFKSSKTGKVVAVHSDWGTGKTWFADRLVDYAKEHGMTNVVVYPAVEFDTEEDPLPSIMATLLKLVPPRNKKLSKAIVPVLKYCVPAIANVATQAISHKYLGDSEAIKSIKEQFSAAAESVAGEIAQDWLKQYDKKRSSIAGLREELKTLSKQDNQHLFIVDELDRCHPKFAVECIERIKHFFEGTGIHFLIFVNRTQLESHLECEFGPHVHKSGHLNKYVDIWFTLNNADRRVPVDAYLAMWDGGNAANHDVTSWVKLCSGLFSASFRDLHRCIELKTCICGSGPVDPLMVPLIFMKVCRPDLYEQLVIGDREGAILVHEEIEKLGKDQAFNVSRNQPMFLEFIKMIPGKRASSQVDERLLRLIRKTPGL